MFGIGTWELVVIFLVALLVLGPRRLPHVARSIGKAIRELRNALSTMEDQLRDASDIPESEPTPPTPASLPPSSPSSTSPGSSSKEESSS